MVLKKNLGLGLCTSKIHLDALTHELCEILTRMSDNPVNTDAVRRPVAKIQVGRISLIVEVSSWV